MVFWIIAILTAALLPAQQTGASLSGTITDAGGAAIPNVEVVAIQAETATRTVSLTNESGFYSLRPLAIGTYSLTVKHAGFKVSQRAGIALSTGQSMELNVTLDPGNVTETVTVTADSPLLESRSAEASQLIESKTIEDMPMGDRRALNIVEITGATVFIPSETGGSPTFSLAGGRAGSQMFWIDGGAGQNQRMGVAQTGWDPPIETLQEIKIMGNGFSAEFGASAGGVVIANTKSGTNKYKGSLFEYFRNQVLDAPNFFSPIVDGQKERPALRYNIFGGTIGGPIVKDKTFFFFAYEGSRRGDGTIRTLTVPTALQRNGDFSQTENARGLAVIYDPATSRRNTANAIIRDPFPGNIVPSGRIDPIARNLAPFFPVANRPPDDRTGANNFRQNDVNRTRRDNITFKIDHTLSGKDKLLYRYLFLTEESVRSSVYPTPAADTITQSNGGSAIHYGAWTRLVSPTMINELRFTYATRDFRAFARGAGEGWPTKLGFKGVADDFFPNIAPAAYAALGSTAQDRQQFPIKQYQIAESLSWIRGKHAVKIGAEFRPSFNHEILRATVSGRYVFSRGFTGAVGNAQTGNGFATMLLGVPTTFETRETDELDRKTNYYAFFLQNDWSIGSTLTLNLGVRWEADSPMRDSNNRINGFDPTAINPVSGTPGVVKFLGVNGYRDTPYDPDWNNWAPRVGIAWRPFGAKKTVVRTGFGVFFSHPFSRAVPNAATLGFEQSAQLILQDNNEGIPYTLSRGIPLPPTQRNPLNDRFAAVAPGVTPTQAITYFEPNRRTGYSLQSSFRIQHELPGRMVFEYGYIGNLSRKLPSNNLQTNQVPTELLKPGVGNKDRPFPQFSGVSIVAPTIGVSSYHAGMLRLEKRFNRGMNLQSTYTWSKFLDNADSGSTAFGNEGAAFSNYYNRRFDWGPSELDIRHRFTLSSVYQLPFGRDRRWIKTGLANKLTGGWSVSGVFVMQSGGPVTVTTQTNTTFAFSAGAQRADVIAEPNLPVAQRQINRWFNTDAFRQPANYTFGNQGIGLIRAPGMVNLNASLIRNFRLAETKTLQFRGELLNAPNHPNFGVPSQVFEGPGFGIVTSARPGRQVQLGLRFVF